MELSQMTREDMEMVILEDGGLYAEFDETRFLDGQYSNEELRTTIQKWIEAGNECR